MTDAWGWTCPALTRKDLANIPTDLAGKLRESDLDEIDDALLEKMHTIPAKVENLKSAVLPQLFGGNGGQASAAYFSTLNWVEKTVEPLFTDPSMSWRKMEDSDALPPKLSKRLRSFKATLDQLEPNAQMLAEQLLMIKDAHAAAESLPTDLQELNEARKKVDEIGKSCEQKHQEIMDSERKSKDTLENAKESAQRVAGHLVEVSKIVDQCGEAYRITTTKGLAGAFDQRATQLATSMWAWVVGLLAALSIGVYIGSERLVTLSAALAGPDPKWGVVAMHLVLSGLSIGGPIWFAWLATKQIGQRFRLAEDYGFKASVAKAYEGYRKEAARIDPAFESRLFGSALTRLEEAPLRLVENASHGSPWHELLNSEVVRTAMQSVPEFKNDVVNLANRAVSTFKPNILSSGKAEGTPAAESRE